MDRCVRYWQVAAVDSVRQRFTEFMVDLDNYRKTTEVARPCDENERGAHIVQALYDMTSHKWQQKLFYLFCTPEGILFDM